MATATVPKPARMPVQAENIPDELKSRAQWVVWRWTPPRAQSKKWNKPLFNARTGEFAATDDPATWSTFDAAIKAYESGRYDGIGYVFGPDDGMSGIDLDNAVDDSTGKLKPWAAEIDSEFFTYAETSPSGTGAKLVILGKLPEDYSGTNRKYLDGGVEIYSQGRYFTITGNVLGGVPRPIADRQDEMVALYHRIKPKITGNGDATSGQPRNAPPVRNGRRPSPVERARLYLQKVPPAIEGSGGDNQTFAAACDLIIRWGLSVDDAWPIFLQYNERCQPPWDEPRLRRKLLEADKQPGPRGELANADRPGYVPPNGTAQCSEESNQGEPHQKSLPKIIISNAPLDKLTNQAWFAIEAANEPPVLYRYAGHIARLEVGDTGEPMENSIDEDRMKYHLARVADWVVVKKVGDEWKEFPAHPPMSVVRDVLATPDPGLPVLVRIVESPVFARDGTLEITPGYHPASRSFYAPSEGFRIQPVNHIPTGDEIDDARDLLLYELLGEFPFVGASEKVHSLAALLLPFVRDMIDGPTPLHLIEKPTPGTGATLLTDMLAYPASGRPIAVMTEGRDEDEWRKRITAKLRGSPAFLLIDNLRRRLDSAAVASAITSPVWEDRDLGLSRMLRIVVRCCWLATGNNPSTSSEIARRAVRIRMDAKLDRPWLRNGFRHPDLPGWARENRSRLVWAALTLIQAWIAAGRPKGKQTLGMFDAWAAVMGGIMDVANVKGFLENLDDFYSESDSEGEFWRALVVAWWEKYRNLDGTGTSEVKAGTLFDAFKDQLPMPLGDGSEQSQKVRLGKLLADMRDRIYEVETDDGWLRLCIRRGGQAARAYLWVLENMGEAKPASVK